MIITKLFDALEKLDLPGTPDLSDDFEAQEYRELLLPITDSAIRNLYIKIRDLGKWPTLDTFKEFAGYLTDKREINKIVNEWEHYLTTRKELSFVANFYFNKAGGPNRFRNIDTTDSFLTKRLRDILDAVWTLSGPHYPSEYIKKADCEGYLPEWTEKPVQAKDASTTELSAEERKKMFKAGFEQYQQCKF